MQGVHESSGVSSDYLRLEALIQKVVSPYLGTHGLFSLDGSSCLLGTIQVTSFWVTSRTTHDNRKSPLVSSAETRLQRSCSPTAKNPVVRSKSYNVPLLTPVVENDPDGGGSGGGAVGIRRHSVCEMTSCVEEGAPPAEVTAGGGGGGGNQSSASGGRPITELEGVIRSVPRKFTIG